MRAGACAGDSGRLQDVATIVRKRRAVSVKILRGPLSAQLYTAVGEIRGKPGRLACEAAVHVRRTLKRHEGTVVLEAARGDC